MLNKLTDILKEALMDLESLEEYYHWQLGVTSKYIRKHIGKYKYAVALEKLFYNLTTNNSTIELSEEEQVLVDSIIDKYEVVAEENEKKVKYSLKNTDDLGDYELSPEKGLNGIKKLSDRSRILFESTLINLLIKYEECISGIFRFLIEKYPEAYLSEKSISYAEIISLDAKLEDVKKRFIDIEVEDLMRQPISSWYKTIVDKHKIKWLFNDNDYNNFTEIYYTRNIIVHNQGIVNDAYINGTKDKQYSLGDKVIIDDGYITKALELTRKILIGTFCGIKKLGRDKNELNKLLFNQGYNYLVDKRWDLAKFINNALLQDPNQEQADILCERFNYWIAEKNISGIDSIKEEVESLDTSSMSSQFVIAKYALLNQFEKVSNELEKAIDKDIPAAFIAEWPLFNDYRESEYYESFFDKHREQFQVFGYDSENENNDFLDEASKLEK